MLRLLNVATPADAATVGVPESVPPAGFVPIVIVTLLLNVVTTFAAASCTCTWMAGAIAAPAVAVFGWTVNTANAGGPGTMLNGALVCDTPPETETTSV